MELKITEMFNVENEPSAHFAQRWQDKKNGIKNYGNV